MRIIWIIPGVVLIVLILVDAFETILQPRRGTHRFRFARLFYRSSWMLWGGAAMLFRRPKSREAFLSGFGPVSLLGLFTMWMCALIMGFALVHWSLQTGMTAPDQQLKFTSYLYF